MKNKINQDLKVKFSSTPKGRPANQYLGPKNSSEDSLDISKRLMDGQVSVFSAVSSVIKEANPNVDIEKVDYNGKENKNNNFILRPKDLDNPLRIDLNAQWFKDYINDFKNNLINLLKSNSIDLINKSNSVNNDEKLIKIKIKEIESEAERVINYKINLLNDYPSISVYGIVTTPYNIRNINEKIDFWLETSINEISDLYLLSEMNSGTTNFDFVDLNFINNLKNKLSRNEFWTRKESRAELLRAMIYDKMSSYIKDNLLISLLEKNIPLQASCNQEDYDNCLNSLDEKLLVNEIAEFKNDVNVFRNLENNLRVKYISKINELLTILRTNSFNGFALNSEEFEAKNKEAIKGIIEIGFPEHFDYISDFNKINNYFDSGKILGNKNYYEIVNSVIFNSFRNLTDDSKIIPFLLASKNDLINEFVDVYKKTITYFLDNISNYSFANICLEGIKFLNNQDSFNKVSSINPDIEAYTFKNALDLLEDFLFKHTSEFTNNLPQKKGRYIIENEDYIKRPSVKALEKRAVTYTFNIIKDFGLTDELITNINSRSDIPETYKKAFLSIISSEILDHDGLFNKLTENNRISILIDELTGEIKSSSKIIKDLQSETNYMIDSLINEPVKKSRRASKKVKAEEEVPNNLFELAKKIYDKESTFRPGKDLLKSLVDVYNNKKYFSEGKFDLNKLVNDTNSIIYKPKDLEEFRKKLDIAGTFRHFETNDDKLNLENAVKKLIPLSENLEELLFNYEKSAFVSDLQNKLNEANQNWEDILLAQLIPFVCKFESYSKIVLKQLNASGKIKGLENSMKILTDYNKNLLSKPGFVDGSLANDAEAYFIDLKKLLENALPLLNKYKIKLSLDSLLYDINDFEKSSGNFVESEVLLASNVTNNDYKDSLLFVLSNIYNDAYGSFNKGLGRINELRVKNYNDKINVINGLKNALNIFSINNKVINSSKLFSLDSGNKDLFSVISSRDGVHEWLESCYNKLKSKYSEFKSELESYYKSVDESINSESHSVAKPEILNYYNFGFIKELDLIASDSFKNPGLARKKLNVVRNEIKGLVNSDSFEEKMDNLVRSSFNKIYSLNKNAKINYLNNIDSALVFDNLKKSFKNSVKNDNFLDILNNDLLFDLFVNNITFTSMNNLLSKNYSLPQSYVNDLRKNKMKNYDSSDNIELINYKSDEYFNLLNDKIADLIDNNDLSKMGLSDLGTNNFGFKVGSLGRECNDSNFKKLLDLNNCFIDDKGFVCYRISNIKQELNDIVDIEVYPLYIQDFDATVKYFITKGFVLDNKGFKKLYDSYFEYNNVNV